MSGSKSISDIESLMIPKRKDRRRSIYFNENIECFVGVESIDEKFNIVDISPQGLSFVVDQKSSKLKFLKNQKVVLTFFVEKNKFHISAEIKQITKVIYINNEFNRIGVKFDMISCPSVESFLSGIQEKLHHLVKLIRPQIFFEAPFFFREKIYLEVLGVSVLGFDVQSSLRNKIILPNMILNFYVFIPGKKVFKVAVQNSSLFYKGAQNYRFYFKFINPEQEFIRAIGEYLIGFGQEIFVKDLRDEGFLIGDLSDVTEFSYYNFSKNAPSMYHLKPGDVAPCCDFKNMEFVAPSTARSLMIRQSQRVVAICALNFVQKKERKNSSLESLGHNLDPFYSQKSFMEILDLYVHDFVLLVDFFVNLIRHVVRIAFQSGVSCIILQSTSKLENVLLKVGFKKYNSELIVENERNESVRLAIYYLPILEILTKKPGRIDDAVWVKVYKELSEYLNISK